ncbi:hypothetical protein [Priestia koreensis]|uniref:Relaxasome subunit MobC n=1 Tax=Priestia koreensis TaxID=284581 RepID=A0A0M0KY68_9BACI|nr:hypothetical protein [Priestia koreensis]KOO43754.1 hypothetical protein AMD01_15465 [Priestia koreensis]
MVRKTDEERLLELENKMKEMEAKKQQIAQRLKEKERKERTRRLIQIGAIFEKHFEIQGEEEAEKVALYLKSVFTKNRDKIANMTKDQLNQLREEQTNRT